MFKFKMNGLRREPNPSTMLVVYITAFLISSVPLKCVATTTISPTTISPTPTKDTIPPNATFDGCPSNILTNETTVSYIDPTASDDSPGGVSLNVSCRPASGSNFAENYMTVVVCTAADAAGNVAAENCTFSVTVDTIPPIATFDGCPNNILTNETTVSYIDPTASDDSPGGVSLNVSCQPASGSDFTENYMTVVVCTAADAAGNDAAETCTFDVTVDTIPPIATFDGCPSNILTNETTVSYIDPTASDDSGGEVSLNVSCHPASGSDFAENDMTVVVCTAADAAGNDAAETCTFSVTVDTIPPIATFDGCPSNILTNETTVSYIDPTASDDSGDGVSLNVSCLPASGSNFAENSMTVVVCKAADAAGNDAAETCTFNVTVDTIPPTFDGCPSNILTNETTVSYIDPTASDDSAAGGVSLNVSCQPASGSDFAENSMTVVVCTAADAAGNDAAETCTFSVTVDTIPPNATFDGCPSNILTNETTVSYIDPTASDDSGGGVSLNVSCLPASGSDFAENDMTVVVCTAADAAGNVAAETCTFNVTVDTIPPIATFDGCPNNILTNETTVSYIDPTASGDSGGEVSLNVSCRPASGSDFTENDMTVVVCRAADAAGNVAAETCTFNVTVDTIPPIATFDGCPNNILTNETTVSYIDPTASGDSGGEVSLNVSCRPASGSDFTENDMTVVVCRAADAAGNVAAETCTFSVTVDVEPPVWKTCPSATSHYADSGTNSTLVTWAGPTASDNFDTDPTVTCVPLSNTRFEIGVTLVKCTAMDAAGNVAPPNCTFNVTVTELRAPVIDNISSVSNESMVITWSSMDTVENFTIEYTGTFQDTVYKSEMVPGSELSYELMGLMPGETYSVKVISQSGLARAESEELKRTTELNDPTITGVSSVEMMSLVLDWSDPPNSVVENYIVIYAGIGTDQMTRNQTVNGSVMSAVLDDLLSGETYKLTVIARSGSEESLEVSADSQEWWETTVPRNVILHELDSTVSSITAQWSPPTEPQSSLVPVIEYYIILCQEGTADPERVNYTMSELNASCVDLATAGREYSMSVESHSNDKQSSASIQIIALPNGVALIEEAPTNTTVRASWFYPGGEASSFVVACSSGTPDPEEIVIKEQPKEQYEATCLNLPVPGDTYVMTVYANSSGKSSNSSHIQLTALPNSVDALTVTDFTTLNVNLSWNTFNCQDCIFTSFNAYHSGDGQSQIIMVNDEKTYETYFDSLVPGREYTFFVTALSGDKRSAVRSVIQRTAPSQINEFASSSTSKTSLTVTWVEASGENDGYNISIEPEGILEHRDRSDLNATFVDLCPGQMYIVSVVTTSGGMESDAFYRNVRTDQDAPGPVSSLAIDNVQLHSVTVSFQEPACIVTGYRITYSGTWKDKTDPEETLDIILDEVPKTIDGLLAGYTYNFTVQAMNDAGLGEATTAIETTKIEAPDSTNPAKPEPINNPATTTSIIALFLDNYFSHDNGELVNYTIIVAQEGADSNSVTATTQTWSDVTDTNPIPPYQAFQARNYPFPQDPTSGRRKRQVTALELQVIIGEDECESNKGYCNGPLRDDTSYVYLFRVWNEAGYADTVFSEPVRTSNDTSLEIGLGVGLTLAILFIICIVLVLIVIKRRRQKTNRRSGTVNSGYEPDLIPIRRAGTSRLIRLEDFPEHFKLMKADSAYLFSEEYEDLRPIGRDQSVEAAVTDCNRGKNRFTNILPYDHTRVKLKQVDDEDGTDYINANFMPGFNSPREFIACQGPLPGTEDNMWRLVWEQKTSTIVMVTQLVEKGRVKCHKYWPSLDKPNYFGDILVSNITEQKHRLWTVREFELEKGGKKHKVNQLNFTVWPDHGVPDNCEDILEFVRSVRSQIPQNGRPTLVHCSAGVGRTGTFICLDRLLLHLKEHDDVDVFGIVNEMRMHRNFMVQTEDQYIFIHECIMALLSQRPLTNGDAIYENVAV